MNVTNKEYVLSIEPDFEPIPYWEMGDIISWTVKSNKNDFTCYVAKESQAWAIMAAWLKIKNGVDV